MKTEKEFIKYKQALILKELGFDEPCIGWYNPQVNYKKVTTDRYWAFHLTGEWENFKPAPLYQQAFRWFREKDFGIIDKPFYSSLDEPKVTYALDIINWKTGRTYKMDRKKSYEEAELACLIKLIEIVKNNEYKQIEYEETKE